MKTAKRNQYLRKLKLRPSKSLKSYVLSDSSCVICGSVRDLTVDHKKPRAKGGSNRRENLQPMCRRCNELKGSKKISNNNLREMIKNLGNAPKKGIN